MSLLIIYEYAPRTLDEGIAEAVSSLIWVAPRLQSDVAELKVVSDLLTAKYGKQYSQVNFFEPIIAFGNALKILIQ